MAASTSCRRWSSSRRSARRPAWILGWRVLTRPSSISGEPVTAATSVTGRPASRSARAVPPVDTSSKPWPTRPRPSSTSPVLSETDSSARRGNVMFRSACSVSTRARRPSIPTAPEARSATAHGRSRCSTAWIRAREAGLVVAGERPGPPPGPGSARRRASGRRDGPCTRSPSRRGPARRPPHGRPGRPAGARDGR